MEMPGIQDIMSTKIISFKKDTSVAEASMIMMQERISGAPVVNEENRIVGILSELDCVQSLYSNFYSGSLDKKVEECMTAEVLSIPVSADLSQVIELMMKNRIRRLPVVDEHGSLVGVLTRGSMFRYLTRMLGTKSWRAF